MHNQQDKMWVTSTPSSEEMGKSFRAHLKDRQLLQDSFLLSPQPIDIWQQNQFEQLAVQRQTYTLLFC